MRIKFKNRIYEVDYVSNPKDTNIVNVRTSNGVYSIDCEEHNYAIWLLSTMLTKGYFDASGVDYNNDQNDSSWYKYCKNKTENEKVFGRWINGL